MSHFSENSMLHASEGFSSSDGFLEMVMWLLSPGSPIRTLFKTMRHNSNKAQSRYGHKETRPAPAAPQKTPCQPHTSLSRVSPRLWKALHFLFPEQVVKRVFLPSFCFIIKIIQGKWNDFSFELFLPPLFLLVKVEGEREREKKKV